MTIHHSDIRKRFSDTNTTIIIPTYNNAQTIQAVIDDVKNYTDHIIVVNDGSTDDTSVLLESASGIHLISYPVNRGKGYAIRCGMKEAERLNYRYAITIDSDGQHFADDLVSFLDEIEKHPDSLLIGARNLNAENMPSKNTFANKFSNFWYKVETWNKLDDTQSGFRLYPVDKLKNIKFFTNRYEFEVEVIVRAAWNSISVRNVPIKVYYPPVEERISHFRPGKDFFRISVLNTCLVLAAYLFFLPRYLWLNYSLKDIKRFIDQNIVHSPESDKTLAQSIGLGVFCGIFPVWGYQMIMAGSLAHFFRLNKVLAVLSSNISIPPAVPFILYGSVLLGGLIMGQSIEISMHEINWDFVKQSFLCYLLGSVILSALCGLLSGLISFTILSFSGRNN